MAATLSARGAGVTRRAGLAALVAIAAGAVFAVPASADPINKNTQVVDLSCDGGVGPITLLSITFNDAWAAPIAGTTDVFSIKYFERTDTGRVLRDVGSWQDRAVITCSGLVSGIPVLIRGFITGT